VNLDKIKYAELILLNIQELMQSEFARSQCYYSGEIAVGEKLGACVDILVHHLAFNHIESTPKRLLDGARALLKDPELKKIVGSQKAFYRMIVGLCFFISEKVPYEEVKI
jgi:hypothetical protein